MWWAALIKALYGLGGAIAQWGAVIVFEQILTNYILPFINSLLGLVPTVEVVPNGGTPATTLYVVMPDVSLFLYWLQSISGTLPLAPFAWYLGLFIIFYTLGNALGAIRFIRRAGA